MATLEAWGISHKVHKPWSTWHVAQWQAYENVKCKSMLVEWPQQWSRLITVIVAPFGRLICICICNVATRERASEREGKREVRARALHAACRLCRICHIISITVERCNGHYHCNNCAFRGKLNALSVFFCFSLRVRLEQPAMKFMQIKLKLQQAEPTLQHMAIRLTPKQRSDDPRQFPMSYSHINFPKPSSTNNIPGKPFTQPSAVYTWDKDRQRSTNWHSSQLLHIPTSYALTIW